MRDRPEDLGLRPMARHPARHRPRASSRRHPIRDAFGILREAARVPAFWALFATFFICGLSTNGLIQSHFIAFCADYGMAQTEAASVLAMMGVFDLLRHDRCRAGCRTGVDNRWLLFWYYGLRGLSLLWLPQSAFSFYGLSIFALFYGLDWIATVPPTVRLAGKIFGREKGAVVFGWIFTGHQLGAAVATFGAGKARTDLATYLPAFYGAGIMCLVAALIALGCAGPARRLGRRIDPTPLRRDVSPGQERTRPPWRDHPPIPEVSVRAGRRTGRGRRWPRPQPRIMDDGGASRKERPEPARPGGPAFLLARRRADLGEPRGRRSLAIAAAQAAAADGHRKRGRARDDPG